MKTLIITLVLVSSTQVWGIDNYEKYLLISNCIYETSNTNEAEKIAVVHVVLNRVKDKRFPNSIEDVVLQPKQFSWTNDMSNLRKPMPIEVKNCEKAVLRALSSEPHSYNHYFLASITAPVWASDKELNAIDKHYFLEL